jgi:pantoate--beta-alanine ligase
LSIFTLLRNFNPQSESSTANSIVKIFTAVEETRLACRAARGRDRRLGLVPTMGALHDGHLSLVRTAKAQCDVVAVSIFVNPTQFGPHEDFSTYPRTFDRDCQVLREELVDLLFSPSADEMYRNGAATWVNVEGLSERLCGKSRPGHFRGVTTVVAKLFHIVAPDTAFFGQKDAAQLAIIRRMVRDLNFPVEIVACPIVREPDGLALSSRNFYLDPQQRKAAPALHRSLQEIQKAFDRGEHRAEKLIAAGKRILAQNPLLRPDYLEIVDPDSLDGIEIVSREALVAVAGFLGTTRLIDNMLLKANG